MFLFLPQLAMAALKYGPAAYSLGKSLFGGGGGGGGGGRNLQEFDRMTNEQGQRGRRMGAQFEEGITGFDPSEYMDRAAGGLFDRFKTSFGKNMDTLRGSQVGMGRLKTGFGGEDEDELFSTMGQDLNSQMSSLAMQGAGMNLDRLGMIGAAGERSTDRAMDARFGRYATDRQSKDQRSAGRWGAGGNIAGALINAAGTYAARPR